MLLESRYTQDALPKYERPMKDELNIHERLAELVESRASDSATQAVTEVLRGLGGS